MEFGIAWLFVIFANIFKWEVFGGENAVIEFDPADIGIGPIFKHSAHLFAFVGGVISDRFPGTIKTAFGFTHPCGGVELACFLLRDQFLSKSAIEASLI